MSKGLAGAEADYVASTPRSRELHGRAVRSLPGGSTRTTTFFPPYPLAIERGEGCRVWDVDGTERLDLIGVLLAPRGLGALSTPMGESEFVRFFEAADRVAEEMAASGVR